MKKVMRKFIEEQAGAITVDWVVLTGAVVIAVAAAYPAIYAATMNSTDNIRASLETATERACEAFASQQSCGD